MSTAAQPAPGLRGLARDVLDSARGHDLALYAAGTTAYAVVGAIPLLLVAVRLAALVVGGGDHLVELGDDLTALLPSHLGAQDSAEWLLTRGASLSLGGAVACLLPASLYGEGVVRALDRLSVRGEKGRRALRGRAGALALLLLAPLLLLVAAGAANVLTRLLGEGPWPRVLGVYLAFLVAWLGVSALLLVAYRVIAPQRPGVRALLWGAFGTGSVVAGFALGWVLFLGITIPVERAYAGSVPLAAAAVSVLWLLLLHVLVLLGYVATLRLDARGGRPRGPVIARDTVRGSTPEAV